MAVGAPVVSVILPVRNAASTVDDQLEALAAQELEGAWELIVVDNASTDATRARVEAWTDRLPPCRVVVAAEKVNGAYARNLGVAHARAELIAFCDGDDVVSPGWLAHLVAALQEHALVTGPVDLSMFDGPERTTGGHRRTLPLAPHRDFLPLTDTCNLGVRREVLTLLGGFHEALSRSHDADFGWRAQLAGHPLHFEPGALVNKRVSRSAREGAVKNFVTARNDPLLYRRFASAGMPRLSPGQAVKAWYDLAAGAPEHLLDPSRRGEYLGWAAFRLGRLVGSVQHRTWFP